MLLALHNNLMLAPWARVPIGSSGHVPFYLDRIEDEAREPHQEAPKREPVYASEIAEFKMPPLRVDFRAPRAERPVSKLVVVDLRSEVMDKPKRSKARLALIAMQLFED